MKLFIGIYIFFKYISVERSVSKNEFETAIREVKKIYRVAGFNGNFEAAPVDLNVRACKLAIWTNDMLLARDLSIAIEKQIKYYGRRWRSPDYEYAKFFAEALRKYCEAWLRGEGVSDSNVAYIHFDKDDVSAGIKKRFPLADDGRLK